MLHVGLPFQLIRHAHEMPAAGEVAKALLDFNASLQGVAAYMKASGGPGWGGLYAPACEWLGVQCDGAGQVTGINMSGWGVAGTLLACRAGADSTSYA